MPIRGLCASHTPLKDFHDPGPEAAREVAETFATARAWVADFAPQLVLVFGPDHFNGFFYRLMPSFCVGAHAEAIGDWNTLSGELPVATGTAEALTEHLHQKGVDAAVSYRMELDHGHTQALQMLFGQTSLPPVLPVFINCAAPPRPPMARVISLGEAVGDFLAELPDRVLIIGSGGLSHDPPMPSLVTADPAVRTRIIEGGRLSAEARRAREARVIDEGRKQVSGESPAVALNPEWDRGLLDLLLRGDFAALSALKDEDISREGGCGGHEIRSWVATAAAMSRVPGCTAQVDMYRAIPLWVAGFAMMRFASGRLG